MNTGMYLSAVLLAGVATTSSVYAAQSMSGEAFQYNVSKLQNACKGKTQGSPVAIAMNRVIFNGTCEVRYMPDSRTRNYDLSDTDQVCSGQAINSKVSATIDGKEMAGKCTLAFKNIGPNNM